jgi:hypothetical protein
MKDETYGVILTRWLVSVIKVRLKGHEKHANHHLFIDIFSSNQETPKKWDPRLCSIENHTKKEPYHCHITTQEDFQFSRSTAEFWPKRRKRKRNPNLMLDIDDPSNYCRACDKDTATDRRIVPT